jgi:hypothetical protein
MATEEQDHKGDEYPAYDYTKPVMYQDENGNPVFQVPPQFRYDREEVDQDSAIISEFDYGNAITIENVIKMFKLQYLPDECQEMVAYRLLESINHKAQIDLCALVKSNVNIEEEQ